MRECQIVNSYQYFFSPYKSNILNTATKIWMGILLRFAQKKKKKKNNNLKFFKIV